MPKLPQVKFLVDESVEYRIVVFLRENGFNVSAITEDSPSISDLEVLNKAFQKMRILITNDSDFGKLIFKEDRSSAGVIFIRMPFAGTSEKILRLLEVFSSYTMNMNNLFITITEKRIRTRLLPKSKFQ